MKSFRFLIPLAAAVALAQPPGPGGPGGPPPAPATDAIQAYLNLTQTQLQGLTQIRQQEAQAIQPLAGQVRAKEQSRRDLLDKGTTDAAALGNLDLEIAALRKQIQTQQAAFRDQARNLLTADQKAKLKTLEDAAKLQPAIMEASGLSLIEPPAAPAGGMRHFRMPGGRRGPMMHMR